MSRLSQTFSMRRLRRPWVVQMRTPRPRMLPLHPRQLRFRCVEVDVVAALGAHAAFSLRL